MKYEGFTLRPQNMGETVRTPKDEGSAVPMVDAQFLCY